MLIDDVLDLLCCCVCNFARQQASKEARSLAACSTHRNTFIFSIFYWIDKETSSLMLWVQLNCVMYCVSFVYLPSWTTLSNPSLSSLLLSICTATNWFSDNRHCRPRSKRHFRQSTLRHFRHLSTCRSKRSMSKCRRSTLRHLFDMSNVDFDTSCSTLSHPLDHCGS